MLSLNLRCMLWMVLTLGAVGSGLAHGQVGEPGGAGGDEEAEALVELNFPQGVELRLLIDYVVERLGMNIVYDEQVGSKAVTLRAPERAPGSSLLPILESVVRNHVTPHRPSRW